MSEDTIWSLLGIDAAGLKVRRTGGQVLGIDLGTTNSTAAEIIFGTTTTPPEASAIEFEQETEEGLYTSPRLPSVVAVNTSSLPLVGEGAKRQRAQVSQRGIRQNQNLFFETKNDMGLRRTYHRAPQGFRSPPDIAAHVLKFIVKQSMVTDGVLPDRVVVTVPASFRAPQRQDTIRAAKAAGIELTREGLLDEPTAAFLDFAARDPALISLVKRGAREVLVFDFGGGTCDVAVLRITHNPEGGIEISARAVSRYYRLGGGDIDRAIFHEVLLPELVKQNPSGPDDLTFEEKKLILEPTFLSDAEALKEGLCSEIRRRQGLGTYDGQESSVVKTLPTTRSVDLRGRQISISRPSLDAPTFEKVLRPFLNPELLAPKDGEYVTSCSIFAPLSDALNRAKLDRSAITDCLLVGGSSLIPQVAVAFRSHFPKAKVHAPQHYEDVKNCVSRGAAYYALALEISGRSPILATAADAVFLAHDAGMVELVPAGARLPFPAGRGFGVCDQLGFPRTSNERQVSVRIEIRTARNGRPIYSQLVSLPGPVKRGATMPIRFRVDSDQILRFWVHEAGAPDSVTSEAVIENPLTNVVDPARKREEIERIEEDLRLGVHDVGLAASQFLELAKLLEDIGHNERALNIYLKLKEHPEAKTDDVLNRLAFLLDRMGNTARAEATFREAMAHSTWGGTRFNFSLFLKQHERTVEAKREVDALVSASPEPAYLSLQALLAEKLGDADSGAIARRAVKAFDPLPLLDAFDLFWIDKAARLAKDTQMMKAIEEKKREDCDGGERGGSTPPLGDLPILRGG